MRPDSEPEHGSNRDDATLVPQPDARRSMGRGYRKTTWGSVGERVREMWKHSGTGSFSEFAQACGVTVERLEEILVIDRIDDETAGILATALNMEYEWVRHGRGPFRKGRAEADVLVGFETAVQADHASEQAGQSKSATDHEFISVGKAVVKTDALGKVLLEQSLTDERYAFRLDWLRSIGATPDRLVLLEVEDDSMSPVLLDGDTVLIDLNRTRFKEGGLFAVGIDEALVVKRLQIVAGHDGPQIRVISVNPEYHTWECRPDDIAILGEVVWFARTLV